MHNFKKITFITIFSIITIAGFWILFSSPVLTYLISKYGIKYTGRKITADWVNLNPLTGTINITNLKIYELKSDSVFFSTGGFSANISMFKLFSKTYEIKNLFLNHPRVTIIQKEKSFNFNDLIDKLASNGNHDTTKAKVHFSIPEGS